MLWILAVFGVFLVTLPWWLPAALVRVAGAFSVEIGKWESLGWKRVVYRDVVVRAGTTEVTLDRVEVPRFLVAPAAQGDDGQDVPVDIGHVRVSIGEATTPRPAAAPPSVPELLEQIREIVGQLRRWVPAAHVGEVSIEAPALRLNVRDLVWDRGALRATIIEPQREIRAVASVELTASGGLVVHAEEAAHDATLNVALVDGTDGGVHVDGRLTWRGMPVRLYATFSEDGLVPTSAEIRAEQFSLPASDIGLKGYGPVTGTLLAQWTGEAYTVTVAARAEPQENTEWPAVGVDLRGSGNLERLRIDAIDVDLPGLQAALSQAIEIDLGGRLPAQTAEFTVEADLAAIEVLEARGRLVGAARIHAADDGTAIVDVTAAGTALGWRDVDNVGLDLVGRWRPSGVTINQLRIDLGPDASSELSVHIDTDNRTVRSGSLRAVVPSSVVRAIWPDAPPYERVELTAQAEGPWAELEHRGRATITQLEWTPGRRIGADVTWSGRGASADAEGQMALAGGGSMPFAVQAARDASGAIAATLKSIRWVDGEGEWWRLEQPVSLSYAPSSTELQVSPWSVRGEGFQITGEARVRWPAIGDVTLVANGLQGRRLGGVLPEAARSGTLERLELKAHWDHGPVEIEGGLRALYSPINDVDYAVEGRFVTREGSLAFGSLEVQDASGVVLSGVGRLPLLMEGTQEGFRVEVHRDEPISLDLASEPNPVFWKSIADLTGWSVEDPRIVCRLHGTIEAPRGEVQFAAARVQPPSTKLATGGQLPELDGVAIKLVADDAGLSIAEGTIAMDYRWITLTGQAPWEVWSRWRETGRVEWRRGEFELATDPLPIAVASRIFPTNLAPEGEVSIRIAHRPDSGFSGRIWLHDAAMRPVGPLGSIREINSELDFSGYVVTLTRLEGLLSGQPVRVTGELNVSNPERNTFALQVDSSRVPLVRQAGLIVRAEVDLALKQDRTGPARVTGRVDFGPSIYSADLLELLPAGVDRPERRPPYFSVEDQPFADWQLDVQVHGEGFLQLTTPFYKDLLSTDARLTGTLREPRVEGWVWGTGGVVTFPFGRIPVDEVLVTLSRENPYEPQIGVSGAGRVLGYDIRMEASGPASEPRLLFTSDPPLTSQQVFLMLTTGAVPSDAYSIGVSDRASRLAMFVGRNLAAGLGLGGGAGGDDRLEVRSGEDFTRAGRETIVVQYDLDGRWSLVGEYDRFDAYNAGIKFRIIDR